MKGTRVLELSYGRPIPALDYYISRHNFVKPWKLWNVFVRAVSMTLTNIPYIVLY